MSKKSLSFFILILLFSVSSVLFADTAKSVGGASFSVPQNWKETDPSSPMRAFQYEIPGTAGEKAELAAFYFGEGQGGDIPSNIERWKSQFTKLTGEKTDKKTVGGMPVTEVLLEGSYQMSSGPMMMKDGTPRDNYAVLGAIIEAPKGAIFLKMTGSGDLVKNAKSDFEAMISSLKKA